MKSQFLRGKAKAMLSLALVFALLFAAVPMTFSASAAETSATATTAAPNTEVYSTSYFNEADLEDQFYQWSSSSQFVDYTGSTDTLSDGVLSVTGGTAGNTRYSAHFHKTVSLDQTVSVAFGMDSSNPAAAAVVWLRAGGYNRGSDYVPTGYYVQINRNGGSCTVLLYKAHENESGSYALTQIGQVANFSSYSSSSSTYLDTVIEATANYDKQAEATVISVTAYKGTTVLYSASFEDNESELQDAGRVGFAVNNNASLTVPFKSFAYHTTDNDVAKSAFSTAYFDETNFQANFTAFGSNTKASVADGVLTIDGSGISNDRDVAQVLTKANLNQNVRATADTPHTYDSGTESYTRSAGTGVVWLKAMNYTRSTGATALIGYFVRVAYNSSDNNATVSLLKQDGDSSGTLNAASRLTSNDNVSYVTIDTKSSSSTDILDVTVEAELICDTAAGSTTINLKIYKSTALIKEVTYTDSTAILQAEGAAALSAQSGSIGFTAFSVSSDDAVSPAYITENTAKADGTMVGMYTAIDPTATYQFSVIADVAFDSEPLNIRYKTASAGFGNLSYTTTTDGVVIDSKYKKYTYTVTLPTDVYTETNTFAGTSSAKTGLTLIFVGYAMNDATSNNIKYTNFELRKVNSDGTVGGNLLYNGDFKMGTYGWSENVTSYAWQTTSGTLDGTVLTSNKRTTYYRDTNNYNYWSQFVYDGYNVGELSGETGIDICDLVSFDALTDYSIFADMDKDGLLNASDEAAIRDAILNPENS